ncbi:MAG: hypothetical protein ACYDAO_04225 [Thermoplasmataceae archaeon]
MMFDIEIDGETVPIQAVKRGEKVYFRFAPYTIDHPTPAQQEVRNRVMIGGHISFDEDISTVNENVKNQFINWVKVRQTPQSEALYNFLRYRYGNDAPSVIEYMTHKPANESYPEETYPNIPEETYPVTPEESYPNYPKTYPNTRKITYPAYPETYPNQQEETYPMNAFNIYAPGPEKRTKNLKKKILNLRA